MKGLLRAALSTLLALLTPVAAQAASLPVQVSVATNSASIRVGSASTPVADISLRFDDASGLSEASLGVRAETVNLRDPALLSRLPGSLASIPSALPMMLTVEPPVSGTLSQRRLVHIELHTHALTYTAGSPFRIFKAQLGGPFRDITEDVQPGSVRTRGTSPGWSQFLIVADLRPTSGVIAEKIAYLRNEIALLPATEAAPLRSLLDGTELAVAEGRYDDAVVGMDSFRARVSARAGTYIPDLWRAARDTHNSAGELLAGANTLVFSIGYLRDFGT
jgi:hypothetical protein